jgi:hypothetical protein
LVAAIAVSGCFCYHILAAERHQMQEEIALDAIQMATNALYGSILQAA